MLVISTWLWGGKYTPEDVMKLRRGVARNLRQPHRFLVVTEKNRSHQFEEGVERANINDLQLLAFKGCFARMRMFDYGWQRKRKIDDRLACLDIDMVITGPLDKIFDRPEPFVILSGANSVNPCPFNGSVMMLRPGYHEEVWTSFSLNEAKKIKFYKFPDDQGWLWHKIPDAATWKCGSKSGIYAYRKPGWPTNDVLPRDASIVAFPGARQPKDHTDVSWVRENWV